jgi:hypothetical protein
VLSAFRPKDEVALKHGLFHSPETLATLRMEAAGRFLRWREVERVVRGLRGPSPHVLNDAHAAERLKRSVSRMRRGERKGLGWRGWDKEKWEREWMSELSRDVALGMKGSKGEASEVSPPLAFGTERASRMDTSSPTPPRSRQESRDGFDEKARYEEDVEDSSAAMVSLTHSHAIDPLHLPSLLLFTVSMFGPLKTRVLEMFKKVVTMPFTIVFSPSSSPSSSPAMAKGEGGQAYTFTDGNAVELSEKQHVRVTADGRAQVREKSRSSEESEMEEQRKWMAVSGLVGVGFCVGVGVGVVAARSADYASS